MKAPLTILLVATLAVSGCGGFRESRMNPRNWFGSSSEDTRPELGPVSDVIDGRPLVPAVTAMTIESTSSGAIVRAEALMPSDGWWDAQLLPENYGRPVGGVLTFRFVAAAPSAPVPGPNTEATRTITAVAALTQAQLETASEIVVVGETNSRRSRR